MTDQTEKAKKPKAKPKSKPKKPKPNKFVDSGTDFISLTDANGKPIPVS